MNGSHQDLCCSPIAHAAAGGAAGAPYPVISTASNQVISDVLTQLLTVGITDQGGPSVGWCQGVCTL